VISTILSLGKRRSFLKQICFIVGTGRCGSTILSRVLNSHSKIVVPPELQFIDKLSQYDISQIGPRDIVNIIEQYCPYRLDEFCNYKDYIFSLKYPQESLGELLKGLFNSICRLYNKETFIEQTPWHSMHLEMLVNLFPDMKIIHLVRDPRDVVISFMKSKWWGEISPKEGLNKWAEIVNAVNVFSEKKGMDILEIRYEDLVVNPEYELSRLLLALGLKFEKNIMNPSMLVDYRKYQKTNTLSLQSNEYLEWRSDNQRNLFFDANVYGWKNKAEYDFGKYICNIKSIMERYGYDS